MPAAWTIAGVPLPSTVSFTALSERRNEGSGSAHLEPALASAVAYEGRGDAYSGSAAATYDKLHALGEAMRAAEWLPATTSDGSVAAFIAAIERVEGTARASSSKAEVCVRVRAIAAAGVELRTEDEALFTEHDF